MQLRSVCLVSVLREYFVSYIRSGERFFTHRSLVPGSEKKRRDSMDAGYTILGNDIDVCRMFDQFSYKVSFSFFTLNGTHTFFCHTRDNLFRTNSVLSMHSIISSRFLAFVSLSLSRSLSISISIFRFFLFLPFNFSSPHPLFN